MDRRDFLRIGGVPAAAALAGCGGALSSAQPKKARKHITAAEEKFATNTEKLNEVRDTIANDDEDVPDEFDPSTVTSRVEKANVELDEAEKYATDEQKSYVQTLRKVGEYQTARAKLYEDYVALYNTLTTANTYIQSERYDDALDKLDETKTLLADVRKHADETESALDDIDADSLTESEQITYESIKTDVSEFRDRLDIVGTMIDGLRSMTLGMQDFMPAVEKYKEGRYQEAAEMIAEAEQHFVTADETFRKLENADVTVSGIETDIAKLTCYTGALAEGAKLFKESAKAAEQGDDELAKQKANEAREAFNKCKFDSA